MPWGGVFTQLPKELELDLVAIPTAVMTAVTTVDTDVQNFAIVNTTGSPITLSIKDTQASAQFYLDAVSIAANTTYSIIADPPQHFKGGLQWQAGGAGLVGSLRGRTHLGLTQGAATTQSNNQLIPV